MVETIPFFEKKWPILGHFPRFSISSSKFLSQILMIALSTKKRINGNFGLEKSSKSFLMLFIENEQPWYNPQTIKVFLKHFIIFMNPIGRNVLIWWWQGALFYWCKNRGLLLCRLGHYSEFVLSYHCLSSPLDSPFLFEVLLKILSYPPLLISKQIPFQFYLRNLSTFRRTTSIFDTMGPSGHEWRYNRRLQAKTTHRNTQPEVSLNFEILTTPSSFLAFRRKKLITCPWSNSEIFFTPSQGETFPSFFRIILYIEH